MAESQFEQGVGGGAIHSKAFRDERKVPAILEVLEGAKVGKVPSRVLLTGGPDLEQEELQGFSLQVLGEGESGAEISSSEEEDGPGPPL